MAPAYGLTRRVRLGTPPVSRHGLRCGGERVQVRSSAVDGRVRQVCPLAPLLYLFAAQALLCWLQSNQVGIRLDPHMEAVTTAVQFADDTEVVLEGMAAVPDFIQCMEVCA